MFTQFEHFAASSLMGSEQSPPRENGSLSFKHSWEQVVFAIAIALSKKGYYEWEDFRQNLIAMIGEWESEHDLEDKTWDYYQRWYAVLEKLVLETGLVERADLEKKSALFMNCASTHGQSTNSEN
jgi:nitrile hydratase accessory protein